MKKNIAKFLLIVVSMTFLGVCDAMSAIVRVKDITQVRGVRENTVVGYGIVTGLAMTGDNSRSTQITNRQLLQNLGTVIEQANYIQKGSSAAVMVTATIPPFAKNGDKIDVTVSTIADAKSLEGGVLVQTHLRAANGEVVAIAQGPISVGGSSKSANGSSKRTSITTTGRIPGGAIMERDMNTQIGDADSLTLVLQNADYTTASRIADEINTKVTPAKALDGSSVKVMIPDKFLNDRVTFLSILENMNINVASERAKVVVNERTGTVIIGNEVKLLPAAVAHGNITVTVKTINEVSQPNPFSGGSTEDFSNSEIDIEEAAGSLVEVKENSSLSDLVRALNAIGVTPFDLITILQALQKAGSLQAEIQVI